MLLSLALIFFIGLFTSEIFKKLSLPGFLGMIITGIILGPNVFNLVSGEILDISSDLRTIALIVILIRAGLSLNIDDLKIIGKPAILMSFIPALFEIIAVIIFAPLLFKITYLEAALLGSILAAVSPAVIVPKMIKLMEQGYGQEKRIPHLVLASASVDDIFVIVLFTSFLSMIQNGTTDLTALYIVPTSIITGVITGILTGILLSEFFKFFRVRDTVKVLYIMAISFFLVYIGDQINEVVPFSSLLSIMVIGITFLNKSEIRAVRLRNKFNKVWVFAELILFVLVGVAVDITVAFSVGFVAVLLIIIELSFRLIGVFLSLKGSTLNKKERLFSGISFLPKATVQAAIGAIPLSLGLPNGELVLALAVLSILVTAPLGAIGIDSTYKRLLDK